MSRSPVALVVVAFLASGCVSHQLIVANPNPTDDEIKHALEGNLCRCTGYINIVESIKWAADKMRGG